MKIVAEIVMAIILLASGFFIAPNFVSELRMGAFKKVNEGLLPLSAFTEKLIEKNRGAFFFRSILLRVKTHDSN